MAKKPIKAARRKSAKTNGSALADVFEIPTPDNRPLKCYAFDPSHGKFFGNEMTLHVKYEKLLPGPVGERIAVIDYDGANKKFYKPVNLDEPNLLISSGLNPTESDPRFHQQMVYAVAMETIQNFEAALGRRIRWRLDERLPDANGKIAPGKRDGDIFRLNLYPHAMVAANAAYSPDAKGILFGYFRASSVDPGRNLPGQTVFTCLSHDIIVHEVTHAILDGIRTYFSERTSSDVAAFHEAFADIAALFRHFSHKEALLDTIQKTGGRLYQYHLEPDALTTDGNPTIQAQKLQDNPLIGLAQQFGEARGTGKALRSALSELPDPKKLKNPNLAIQFRSRDDADAKEALAQLGNATGIEDFNAAASDKKKVSGGNAAALDTLKIHLGSNGDNVRYYAAGDNPDLPKELQGLKATILGPPPEKARAFLALMDLKKGVGQYLDSMTNGADGPSPIQPFSKEWIIEPKDYPKQYGINYDEITQRVNTAQPDMLATAAAKIENFLNNQSLVVLFEFDGKKLLFAGDAQGGNWEYWLYQIETPLKDPTDAGDIVEASKELLQTIDFYKVGHHGSTNATPIPVIDAAVARPKMSKGFVSMCSTEDGVYGNPDKDTEVPRRLLMDELNKGSCLVRSDSIRITFTDRKTNEETTVDATDGVTFPTPKAGKLTKTKLYIEYAF